MEDEVSVLEICQSTGQSFRGIDLISCEARIDFCATILKTKFWQAGIAIVTLMPSLSNLNFSQRAR